MSDRIELLEAALDSLPYGIAIAGDGGKVTFWNRAAASITGYTGPELLGRSIREALDAVVVGGAERWILQSDQHHRDGRGMLVHARHKLGHEVAMMARIDVLRDGLGGRIGTAAVFHPVERLDALPHGDCGDDTTVQTSQRDLEERLDACFDDFVRGGIPLGILWIEVDQAAELRRTHGLRACEAMLEIVAHSLGNGLRPTDELGRWGEDEFLVIAHERASEMLIDHAQTLAGLARTADFRWWGDRISLTASIGAAQAVEGDLLAALLARAQAAMEASVHSGGNHVTHAAGGLTCSQS